MWSVSLPWSSGVHFKRQLVHFKETAAALIYTRDHGAGRVTVDGDGKPNGEESRHNHNIIYEYVVDYAAFDD